MLPKIFIISPSHLPIPSVKGGAVETLIDHFIGENEKKRFFYITVFSSYDEDAFQKSQKYRYTHFKYIKQTTNRPNNNIINRVLRKFFNLSLPSSSQKELIKLVKLSNPNLVIIEGNEKLIAPIAKYIPKTKIWFHAHANSFFNFNDDINNAIQKCNKIIAVSNFIKEEILKNYKIKKEKVTVIRNCVNIEQFTIPDLSNETLKTKKDFNIKNDETVFLYAGRIVPEKGIKELINAFNRIQNEFNAKLILAGSFGHSFGHSETKNKFYDEIKLSIKDFEDKVIFTGFIPNMELPKLYKLADIIVVPSQCDEAAPLSVIEARVAGIPLITSNSGGIPEYVNEQCAIIVNRGTNFTGNLIKAMSKLLTNIEFRNQIKKYNKKNNTEFSTQRYYNEFSQLIIKELIND